MTNFVDQFDLIPPYCPNLRCSLHFGTSEKFYVKNGFAITDKPPFRNQRFKCAKCKIQFFTNTFGLDFRKQGTVRDRLKNMARQSVIFEKENYPEKNPRRCRLWWFWDFYQISVFTLLCEYSCWKSFYVHLSQHFFSFKSQRTNLFRFLSHHLFHFHL